MSFGLRVQALAVAAVLCGLGACATPSKGTDEGWQPIFDGRTLAGWTPKVAGYPVGEDTIGTFTVADGAIRVGYDRYGELRGRFGHLFYNRPFKSFRLKLKYRIVGTPLKGTPFYAEYNSGVMIFAQSPSTMSRHQAFPVSAEAQLLGRRGTDKRTNGNVCTPGTHITIAGKLTRIHCVNSTVPVPPNGTWRDLEIGVSPTGHVIQRVDGVTALEYDRVEYDPADKLARPLIAAAGGNLVIGEGYIALQSEGQPIEFKDIWISDAR